MNLHRVVEKVFTALVGMLSSPIYFFKSAVFCI